MIRNAITINLVPEVQGGPYVFDGDLAAACQSAAKFEFDAIEILPAAGDAVPTSRVWKVLNEHDLKLAAVNTDAGWLVHRRTLTSADATVRQQARDFVRAMIDFAGPFGAPTSIGLMQGRWGGGTDRNTAMNYLEDALEELADHAKQYRVPLLYEPLNREESNLVNLAADAVSLVKRLATNNVRLLGNLYHMSVEEKDVAAALHQVNTLLGHLHFVDSNRRPAGCGSLDFAPIVATLNQIGYNSYVSAEALPWPDAIAAADQTMKMYQKLFTGK